MSNTPRKTIRPPKQPWLPDDDVKLRQLWDAEFSTLEIGKRIGRGKNSVVGRAHRLNLPPRPTPICYGGVKQAAVKERKPDYVPVAMRGEGPVRVAPKPVFVAPPPMRSAPLPGAMKNGCRWPLWRDDERPTQRFCGAARYEHWSYCAEHGMIAYAPRGQVNGK